MRDEKTAEKMLEWLRNLLNFSFRKWSNQKRKEKFERFEQELQIVQKMGKNELLFEYIETKTEYDHKKNISAPATVIFAIAILMCGWSKFCSFVQLAYTYIMKSEELAITYIAENEKFVVFNVSILFLATMFIFVMSIFVVLLFGLSKDIKILNVKLKIIETVLKEQDITENNQNANI